VAGRTGERIDESPIDALVRRGRERWISGRRRTPVVLLALSLLSFAWAGRAFASDGLSEWALFAAGAGVPLAAMAALLGRATSRVRLAKVMPGVLAVTGVGIQAFVRWLDPRVWLAGIGFCTGLLVAIFAAWALDPEWFAVYKRARQDEKDRRQKPPAERLLKRPGPKP
jgi:hypothetical protein